MDFSHEAWAQVRNYVSYLCPCLSAVAGCFLFFRPVPSFFSPKTWTGPEQARLPKTREVLAMVFRSLPPEWSSRKRARAWRHLTASPGVPFGPPSASATPRLPNPTAFSGPAACPLAASRLTRPGHHLPVRCPLGGSPGPARCWAPGLFASSPSCCRLCPLRPGLPLLSLTRSTAFFCFGLFLSLPLVPPPPGVQGKTGE